MAFPVGLSMICQECHILLEVPRFLDRDLLSYDLRFVFCVLCAYQVQQIDMNHGSVMSVLTVSTTSPKGQTGDTSDVSVTLPPLSSIEIGKATVFILTLHVLMV